MAQSKSYIIIATLTAVLLLASRVLQIYGPSFSWSYYSIPVFVLGLFSIAKRAGKKNNMPKLLKVYFVYLLLIYYLDLGNQSSIIPYTLAVSFVSAYLFWNNTDMKILSKTYDVLGFVFLFFFYIQFVARLSGIVIPGIIPGLPIALHTEASDLISNIMMLESRPASFFSEPSHLAEFLTPLLFLKLFGERTKYNNIYAALITVAMLLMNSGTALAAIIPLYIGFMYYKLKTSKTNFVFIAILFTVVYSVYSRSEYAENLQSRTEEISITRENGVGQSGYIRFFRGFYIYDDFDVWEKIVGVSSSKKFQYYLSHNQMSYTFADENDTFLNTYQSLLIKSGIIGFFIFMLLMVKLWRGNTYEGRIMLTVYLLMSFFAPFYMSSMMHLYLLMASMSREKSLSLQNN